MSYMDSTGPTADSPHNHNATYPARVLPDFGSVNIPHLCSFFLLLQLSLFVLP